MPLYPINDLNYNSEIQEIISLSGGTIIFTKDNIIVASEISQSQYIELMKNPYIDKIDVLPLKRYSTQTIYREISSTE